MIGGNGSPNRNEVSTGLQRNRNGIATKRRCNVRKGETRRSKNRIRAQRRNGTEKTCVISVTIGGSCAHAVLCKAKGWCLYDFSFPNNQNKGIQYFLRKGEKAPRLSFFNEGGDGVFAPSFFETIEGERHFF